jgi:hypothetical protein
MASKGYTSKTAVEGYLGKVTGLTDAILDTYIEGVEKVIDQMTGRNFKADSAASARTYDGDDTDRLLIDDCVEITKVEVGLDSYGDTFQEVAATGADRYFVLPANRAALSVPAFGLALSARVWAQGQQNNRVTAKWGYSASVPADIAFAACVFVAGIVNFRGDGGIKSESIGNYSVSFGSESRCWADFEASKAAVEAYRRIQL